MTIQSSALLFYGVVFTVYHPGRGLFALLISLDGTPRPVFGISDSKTPTSFFIRSERGAPGTKTS